MAEISAALVKELRTKTGAGMMDCKKALAECEGDLDAATDWLRTKGLAAAQKKAGRTTVEGLIGLATAAGKAALVEVNSETDFVARNDQFQDFVDNVARIALDSEGDMDAVRKAAYPGTDRTVEEELTQRIATIGENMTLRRAACVAVSPGIVAQYMHNAVTPGLGKIGVIVALKSEADGEALANLGKQLAMHIAAAAPKATTVEQLDPSDVEREREFLMGQARESGKPEDIIEKMVEGRLRKFYEESVLLAQTWVIDGESKVEDVVKEAAKELGAPIEVTEFRRFELGEGAEKRGDDFAEETSRAPAG